MMLDAFGKDIKHGDRVLYAARDCYGTSYTIGTIVAFPKPTISNDALEGNDAEAS